MEHGARRPYSATINWLFRSRETGRITIAQWPNAPLLFFFAAAALRLLVHPRGGAAAILGTAATVALIAWALLEVLRGVNPFRRVLGAVVLLAQLVALVPR